MVKAKHDLLAQTLPTTCCLPPIYLNLCCITKKDDFSLIDLFRGALLRKWLIDATGIKPEPAHASNKEQIITNFQLRSLTIFRPLSAFVEVTFFEKCTC